MKGEKRLEHEVLNNIPKIIKKIDGLLLRPHLVEGNFDFRKGESFA